MFIDFAYTIQYKMYTYNLYNNKIIISHYITDNKCIIMTFTMEGEVGEKKNIFFTSKNILNNNNT